MRVEPLWLVACGLVDLWGWENIYGLMVCVVFFIGPADGFSRNFERKV